MAELLDELEQLVRQPPAQLELHPPPKLTRTGRLQLLRSLLGGLLHHLTECDD